MSTAAATSPISLLDVKRQTAAVRHQLNAAIARVLDHGQFIMGPEVSELETRIAQYCGSRFAVACASGSDALLLPLMALGMGDCDRVITTPFTFFASAGSISRAGGTPVFVDIDPGTFNMDPEALARYLNALTAAEVRRVRAIMPVHLFGQCADMSAISAVAASFGIPVIEDAAQAIGAEYSGKKAGAMALCGAFSFFPSKNLGGLGDAGMITTDDAAFADRLRLLRVHGSGGTYFHKYVGVNSRMDTLQAACLLVKLEHLDEWTAARRANAAVYRASCGLEPGARIRLPFESPNAFHVYNQFTVRVPHRDEIRRRLAETNVGTAVYYPLPLHLQECFASLGYTEGDFPVSEIAAREVLSLPIEPGLGREQVETVAERLTTVLQGI